MLEKRTESAGPSGLACGARADADVIYPEDGDFGVEDLTRYDVVICHRDFTGLLPADLTRTDEALVASDRYAAFLPKVGVFEKWIEQANRFRMELKEIWKAFREVSIANEAGRDPVLNEFFDRIPWLLDEFDELIDRVRPEVSKKAGDVRLIDPDERFERTVPDDYVATLGRIFESTLRPQGRAVGRVDGPADRIRDKITETENKA